MAIRFATRVWLVALAGLLAVGAPTASAAWPGRNGPIVFTAHSGCQFLPCEPLAPGVLPNGLWRINPSGGGLRQLISEREGAFFNPVFSRTGRLLLGSSNGLVVTDVDARDRPYDAAIHASDATWMASGQVGFSKTSTVRVPEEPPSRLCGHVELPSLHETTGTESAPLPTTTRYAYAPAFAAKRRLMAYHGYDSFEVSYPPSGSGCVVGHVDSIWVQRLDAPRTGRRLFVDRSPGRLRRDVAPDFSPDARQLAVVTTRGVVVIDLARRRARRLPATRYARSVAWSPNGRWLAVTLAASRAPARTKLVLIPARGGKRRTLGSWTVGPDCRDCGLYDVAWQRLPPRS